MVEKLVERAKTKGNIVTFAQIKKAIREKERKIDYSASSNLPLPANVTLIHGDCREKLRAASGLFISYTFFYFAFTHRNTKFIENFNEKQMNLHCKT